MMPHARAYLTQYLSALSRLTLAPLFIFVLTCSSPSFASASAGDVHKIVNICTNVQRVDELAAKLSKNSSRIDSEFAHLLEKPHLGKSVDTLIRQKQQAWQKIRQALIVSPNKELMQFGEIDQFNLACWEIANTIAQQTHIDGEQYFATASKLGFKIQSLTTLYMARAWGIADLLYREEVAQIMVDYEIFHHELTTKAYPTFVEENIKQKLAQIEKGFYFSST